MESIGGINIKIGADNQELIDKLNQSKSEIGKIGTAVSQFGDNIGVLRQRYRELSKMSLVGKSAEEIRAVEAEMAKLRDAIGDYNSKISSMAKDPFQKAAEGVQTMSTMLAGAAGAASLFGGNQERLNELMQKTVALIAIAQAAQTAADFTRQNAIGIYIKQKTSEIALKIKEALTINTVTAATASETAAKSGLSAVQKTLIFLQNAWNKAIAASPIFLLITVIAGVVAGVVALNNALSRNSKAFNEAADMAGAYQRTLESIQSSNKYDLDIMRAYGEADKAIRERRLKQIEDEIATLERLRAEHAKLATETKTFGFGLTERAKESKAKLEEINKTIIELGREQQIIEAQLQTEAIQREREAQRKRLEEIRNARRQAIEAIAEAERESWKMLSKQAKVNVSIDLDLPPADELFGEIDEMVIEPLKLKGVEIGEILSQAVEGGLEDMIAATAEAIGAFAAGEASMGDIFKTIGLQVANFADGLGKALIAAGVAGIAFKKLLANPIAAIAAGAALVATAAIVRAKLKAGPGGSESAGGGGYHNPSTSAAASPTETWETRNVQMEQPGVVISGTLKAQGSELVAVLDSENKRRSY